MEIAITNRTAIVTFRQERCGILAEIDQRDTRFVYDKGWTQSIACSLPAEQRDHYWRNGLLPFFEHLAPEGWLRGRQAREARTETRDDFGILLAFGEDCIGAVGIAPPDGVKIALAEIETLEGRAATVPGKTVSGVQKKLLAYRDGAAYRPSINRSDPATHIAKFNAAERATLVQNENLTLTLAREVLGEKEVTAAHIAKLEGIDEIALVVERFDRADGRRLRLEDFAQILEVPSGRDFGGKYQSSYEEAASVIAKWSSRSAIDLLRFFRLIVFNCVVGNADAHLKNFSLLERPEGLRLSPAYDLMNTVVYGEYDADTGLSIDGERRPLETVERSLLIGFGREIGLEEAAIERAFSDLARKFADPETLKFGPNVSFDDFRARYAEVIQANAQRIFA